VILYVTMLYRQLFFLPLFLVEFSTLSLLILLPSMRVTAYACYRRRSPAHRRTCRRARGLRRSPDKLPSRRWGWKVALASTVVGTAAAPMIFELPFDLIVMARTNPPIPIHPYIYTARRLASWVFFFAFLGWFGGFRLGW
jgi:hypothetical protein